MQRYLLSIAATLLLILIVLVGSVPLLDWYEQQRHQAQIAESRTRWQEHVVDRYAFTIRKRCSCPPPGNLPLRFTVVDARVTSVVQAETGEALSTDGLDEIPHSIPAVFDELVDIVVRRPDELVVAFDERFGFPSVIEADFDEDFNHDDVSYEIVDFRVIRNEP